MTSLQSVKCPDCGAQLEFESRDLPHLVRCSYCDASIIIRPENHLSEPEHSPPHPEVPELPDSFYSLIAADKKIEAIKLYRQIANVGLKEAKDAVLKISQGLSIAPYNRQGSSAADLTPVQKTEILALLSAGRKIDAIKLYRQWCGCGLKEAKEAVDQMS
ncbi:MAG: hypothetical protein OEZ02_02330, partial [Anaerolineae bacterium]|nr:hypothetical protein [Anaerolineae bacterium]